MTSNKFFADSDASHLCDYCSKLVSRVMKVFGKTGAQQYCDPCFDNAPLNSVRAIPEVQEYERFMGTDPIAAKIRARSRAITTSLPAVGVVLECVDEKIEGDTVVPQVKRLRDETSDGDLELPPTKRERETTTTIGELVEKIRYNWQAPYYLRCCLIVTDHPLLWSKRPTLGKILATGTTTR